MSLRQQTLVPALDGVVSEAVDSGDVPGLVAVVADRSGVVYESAAGTRDVRAREPMTVDTVFRIASMTKLATSVALLQLVERGKVDLDTPVRELLPEFGALQILTGFDGTTPRLRPQKGAATVRQLITHTSGLGYAAWHAGLKRYHELTGARELGCGVRAAFAEAPLVADAGTSFHYSTGVDWAGLVIESVSGRLLQDYWAEELFGPLGMTDTVVWPSAEQRSRSAAVHVRSSEGAWGGTDIDLWQEGAPEPEFYPGGHCLYSTAGDHLALQRAMLHDGELDGVRILKPETVEDMFQNHIGEIEIEVFPAADPAQTVEVDLGRGAKWGLGIWIATERIEGLRPAGSGGWSGLFNTFFWIDRANGVTAAFHTQTLPFYEPRVMDAERAFERTVSAAMVT